MSYNHERASELAEKIRELPGDPAVEREVDLAIREEGEEFAEMIADALTAEPGGYSQSLQDRMLPKGLELNGIGAAIKISPIETEGESMELPMIAFLSQLIPGDFYRIPREARMSPVESEVWGFFLRGYCCQQMVEWVLRPDGRCYSLRGLRKVLERAVGKVCDCPSLGWRTCLAEDMARGRHAHGRPLTISWLEVFHS